MPAGKRAGRGCLILKPPASDGLGGSLERGHMPAWAGCLTAPRQLWAVVFAGQPVGLAGSDPHGCRVWLTRGQLH